jgi:hypothetical protein
MLNPEIIAEFLFQLLVERAAVRQFATFPNFLQIWDKFFEWRQMRPSYIDCFFSIHCDLLTGGVKRPQGMIGVQ